jgi:hypothetical protein
MKPTRSFWRPIFRLALCGSLELFTQSMFSLSRIEIKNPFPLLLLVIGLGLFPVSPLAAQTFSTLYNFSALDANGLNSDGAGPYAGLVLSGNTLYGTTQFGGTGQSC